MAVIPSWPASPCPSIPGVHPPNSKLGYLSKHTTSPIVLGPCSMARGIFSTWPTLPGAWCSPASPRHPHPPHSRFPTGTLYTVIPLTVSCRRARQPLVLLTPPHQGVAWCWHSAQQLLRAGGGRGEGRPGPCWLSGRSLGRGAGRAQTPKM